uniref:Mitogen-activated protein kinase kinase kinase 19 n=1 Tax=Xiphophorus couchianus TaxID=32473 RepID=A0A3B5MIC0_9TELE
MNLYQVSLTFQCRLFQQYVYCGLTSQGQLIAVKQVCLDSSDPDAAKKEYNRLQGEVELLKTLCHSNIVGFLGTSLYQHVVSIFMEYIPGGSIASILHRFGPLPERVLALYTHQILEGVAFLHQNRVIHRDLKGNNVMLMPTGVIKLIDFGCARRLSCLNHTAPNSGELLKSIHGTPYWMAPEIINESGYGRKSDIWSVGCTVFEMATGKPPLAHMDKMAALFYIGARRGLMPSLPDGFSENAKDFVKICLTSDQSVRPSADQLLKHSFIPKGHTSIKYCECHSWRFCSLWSRKSRMRGGGCGRPRRRPSFVMTTSKWRTRDDRVPFLPLPPDQEELAAHPQPQRPLARCRCACGGDGGCARYCDASPCSPTGWNVCSCCCWQKCLHLMSCAAPMRKL